MKAPHRDGLLPHRGYSGLGKEKLYSKDEVAVQDDVVGALRKMGDFKACLFSPTWEGEREGCALTCLQKESYEIGSEHNDQQGNIWLPEEVLPGFQTYMSGLYDRFAVVGKAVFDAISVGLGLTSEDRAALMQLNSAAHSQLRLLQ